MVLIISLIILVALTMAGIALVRSVDTTSLISGNLAFQQAALYSGEAGLEDAANGFLEVSDRTTLENDSFGPSGNGYSASVTNPTDWDTYWTATVNPNPVATPVLTRECKERACILPTDATGNTVSYTIQRLCATAGDPFLVTTGCATNAQPASASGGSQGSGKLNPLPAPQHYYRVTARVEGPRNTLVYLQTIVAK